MGFTRYIEIKEQIDPEKFKNYSLDCKTVCQEISNQFRIKLASWDGTSEPDFTDTVVSFNGFGDDSCETFHFSVNSGPALGNSLEFVKTNRKPYDKHVLACLILAKYHFKDAVKISSDGDNNDDEIINFIKFLKRDSKIKVLLNE